MLRARIDQPLRIADLAASAAMSERTFLRRFQAATGMTPADWIVRARLDIARELLERTGLSIEQIATRTGLGTAMTMRHHFRRKMGVSPLNTAASSGSGRVWRSRSAVARVQARIRA